MDFGNLTADEILSVGKQYALGSRKYTRNCHLAVECFLESSRRGNLGGTFRYALSLFEGMGIEKDRDSAQRIAGEIMPEVARRSDAGEIFFVQIYADAFSFGLGVTQDLGRAVSLYQIAAEAGNLEAQCSLAFCYRYAMGCEENPELAFRWWKISAEAGYPHSSCDVGECYRRGYGVAEDKQEAFRWFKESSECNYPSGISSVASCYLHGEGTDENRELAAVYFRKAIDLDYKRGCRAVVSEGLDLRAFLERGELRYDLRDRIERDDDYQVVRGVVYINNRIREINIDCMRREDIVKIIVELDNEHYSSIDGSLYNKSGTELLLYPMGRKLSDFTRPESMKVCKDSRITQYEKSRRD